MADDRLRTAFRELLRTRTAALESTARQQRRAEETLICLLFPQALNSANIAAHALVAPPDPARRISALLTSPPGIPPPAHQPSWSDSYS
ncbi:MAG: hypothetical protein ACR2P2_02825 [Nakamurella sp.]